MIRPFGSVAYLYLFATAVAWAAPEPPSITAQALAAALEEDPAAAATAYAGKRLRVSGLYAPSLTYNQFALRTQPGEFAYAQCQPAPEALRALKKRIAEGAPVVVDGTVKFAYGGIFLEECELVSGPVGPEPVNTCVAGTNLRDRQLSEMLCKDLEPLGFVRVDPRTSPDGVLLLALHAEPDKLDGLADRSEKILVMSYAMIAEGTEALTSEWPDAPRVVRLGLFAASAEDTRPRLLLARPSGGQPFVVLPDDDPLYADPLKTNR